MPRRRGQAVAAGSSSDNSSIGSDAGGGAVKQAHNLSRDGKLKLNSAQKKQRPRRQARRRSTTRTKFQSDDISQVSSPGKSRPSQSAVRSKKKKRTRPPQLIGGLFDEEESSSSSSEESTQAEVRRRASPRRGGVKRERNRERPSATKRYAPVNYGYGGDSDDNWIVNSDDESSQSASDASSSRGDAPAAANFTHAAFDRVRDESMDAAKADRGAGVCATLGLLPGVALNKQSSMHVYAVFLLLQLVYPGTLPFLRAVPACPDAQLYRQVWKAVEEPLAARREALLTSQVWSPAMRKLVHTLPRMRFSTNTPNDALYIVDPVMQDKFERDEIGRDGVQELLDQGAPLPVVPHGLDNKCGVCRIKRRHATVVLTFFGRRIYEDGLWDDVNAANSSGSVVLATANERTRALKRAQASYAKQRAQMKAAVQDVLSSAQAVKARPSAASGAGNSDVESVRDDSSSGSDADSRPIASSTASVFKKATQGTNSTPQKQGEAQDSGDSDVSVDSMDDIVAPGVHRKGATLVIASKPPASSLWGAAAGKLPPSYAEVTVHSGWEAHIPRGVQSATLKPLRKGVFDSDAAGAADVGSACYGVVPPESYSDSEGGNAYQGSVSEDDSASDYIEDGGAMPPSIRKRRRHAAQDTGLPYIEAGVPRECMPRWVAAGRQCASRVRAYHAVHHFKYRLLCDLSTHLHAFATEVSAAAKSAASVSYSGGSWNRQATDEVKAHASTQDDLFPLISSMLGSYEACVRVEEAARATLQGFEPQKPDMPPANPQGYTRRPSTAPATDFMELPQYALPPPPPTAFLWAFLASTGFQQVVTRWCGIHDTLSRIATAKYTSEMTRKQQREEDAMLGEDWLDVLEDDVAAEILPLPRWAGTTALRPPFSGTESLLSGPMPLKMPTFLSTETRVALGSEEPRIGAMRSEMFSLSRESLAAQGVCTVDVHDSIAEAAEATAVNNDVDEHSAGAAVAQQRKQLRHWAKQHARHTEYRSQCRKARSLIVRGLAESPAKKVVNLSESDSSTDDSMERFKAAKRTQSLAMSAHKRRARRRQMQRDDIAASRDSVERHSSPARRRAGASSRSPAPSSSTRRSFRRAARKLRSAGDSLDESSSDTSVDAITPLKSLAAAKSPPRAGSLQHALQASSSSRARRRTASPRQRLDFGRASSSSAPAPAAKARKRGRNGNSSAGSDDTEIDSTSAALFDEESSDAEMARGVSVSESVSPRRRSAVVRAITSSAKRRRPLHLQPVQEAPISSSSDDDVLEVLPEAAQGDGQHSSAGGAASGGAHVQGAPGVHGGGSSTPELKAGAAVRGLGDLTPGSGGRWELVYDD